LLQQCIEHAKLTEIHQICLEVGRDNLSARRLYGRLGFNVSGVSPNMVEMIIILKEAIT
jgi:ribosomal protein S18 acetylase RimI-like enzyme